MPRFRRLWRSWWPTLALIAGVLSFRSAVADWYDVPTGSMQPTIYVGDRILVDKTAYDWRLPLLGAVSHRADPARGDIVTFASPAGQETRDRDRRALLRWALPVLNEILGTASRRWLVVSADDPMWRGGLSGPDSLYLHADRPLIAPDDTSPLLHEIVHVAMGAQAGPESDWIVEGLAELYSLELLRRAGALSAATAAPTRPARWRASASSPG